MAPGDRSGVTGDQKEGGNGLEGPRQPLRPGLINKRILPTEDSVAIGHRSGQPVAQHDENHPRHAVEVHCRVADRALGHTQKVPVTRRCRGVRGMRRPRWPNPRQGRPRFLPVNSCSRRRGSTLHHLEGVPHMVTRSLSKLAAAAGGLALSVLAGAGIASADDLSGRQSTPPAVIRQVVAALNAQSRAAASKVPDSSAHGTGLSAELPRFATAAPRVRRLSRPRPLTRPGGAAFTPANQPSRCHLQQLLTLRGDAVNLHPAGSPRYLLFEYYQTRIQSTSICDG